MIPTRVEWSLRAKPKAVPPAKNRRATTTAAMIASGRTGKVTVRRPGVAAAAVVPGGAVSAGG
jgi:hypothetical protein